MSCCAATVIILCVSISSPFKVKAYPAPQTNVMTKVNKILVFIPVLFIVLRVWATVQYFFSVYVVQNALHNGHCIPNDLHVPHVVLGVLQVRTV